ncbi:MAG: CoA transferase [Alphaproteobacteria bacterium]|nr:CoA transferase [Alphaproteobacteria bacterium]
MPRDLEGILVVTLEQAVAAPYASSRLADAGARVIKLEREEGDFARRYDTCVNGESAYFVWLNRGKESIRFDFKDDDDKAMLRRMLARADVFIQNLAPGAVARAGFTSADLRAEFPRLITCDISGYGEEGPFRDMKAYDLLVQAESGLAAITGSPSEPGRVGVSVCDIACGMYAHQAILQALFARERTGRNRGIQVSLYGAMADWMNVPYLQHRYGGQTPGRPGLNHPTIAPYGAYDCGDGKPVLISIQNEREWRSLCENVLGGAEIADDPRFATNPDRVANRPALDAIILGAFGRGPREEIIAKLEAAKIAYGRLSSLDDLVAHPQNRLIEVKTSAGDVQVLAPPPIAVGETESYGPVPALGEHDAAVRAEFAN